MRFALIALGHLAFGAFTYGIWAGGQKFGAEIMMSEAVFPTMVLGIVSLWLWYAWWGWKTLREPKAAEGSQ
jgi:hypothetical protein